MADQERNNEEIILRSNNSEQNDGTSMNNTTDYTQASSNMAAPVNAEVPTATAETTNYREETAAEMAAPVSFDRDARENRLEEESSGRGMGYAALALSILSLFVWPVLFGAVGIVLGFLAVRRGATGLGSWAIGIGAVSIIIGIFVMPFF
ncbi:DUF4190 domain-containing protein [Cytobacillus sp. Hz8]|uniref:DUF4190 domain-containing protein n=1 Tax=Cytobacillus sp. Hz8 TaxID=3347168 RepID=UPI0035D9BBF6